MRRPRTIIVAEHPRHGVWVMSVCDEHLEHARKSLSGTLAVSHSEGCTGGDGFVGWAE